jgi:hypothetical protein
MITTIRELLYDMGIGTINNILNIVYINLEGIRSSK